MADALIEDGIVSDADGELESWREYEESKLAKRMSDGKEVQTCDDCGTDKGIVGDLRGTLCHDCMTRRSQEHFKHLANEKIKKNSRKWC